MWRALLAGLILVLFIVPRPAGAQGADPFPEAAYVEGVRGLPQSYSLSCESRSAVDWAAFFGVKISEREFLMGLPRSDNPDVGFVGSPDDLWGALPPYSYGVHAKPVAALLRRYGLPAEARSGLNWDILRAEIVAGRPVIVWVVGQMWKGTPVEYRAADGQVALVTRFEHSMILVGYNGAMVRVVDAYTGREQSFRLKDFKASWATLGRMAVLAVPPPAVTPPAPNRATATLVPAVALAATAAAAPATSGQSGIYKVQSGDYLLDIARRLNVPWQELAALNHLSPPYTLYRGMALRLPPTTGRHSLYLALVFRGKK